MREFDFNDSIRIPAEWLLDGRPIDPDTAVLTIHKPDNTTATFTYPTDSGWIHPKVGRLYRVIVGNQSGTWKYRWTWSGTHQGVFDQGQFTVKAVAF